MNDLEEELKQALTDCGRDRTSTPPTAGELIRRAGQYRQRFIAATGLPLLFGALLWWRFTGSPDPTNVRGVTSVPFEQNEDAATQDHSSIGGSRSSNMKLTAKDSPPADTATWQLTLTPADVPGHVMVMATRSDHKTAIPICIVRPAQVTEIPFWTLTPGEQDIIRTSFSNAGYETEFEL